MDNRAGMGMAGDGGESETLAEGRSLALEGRSLAEEQTEKPCLTISFQRDLSTVWGSLSKRIYLETLPGRKGAQI